MSIVGMNGKPLMSRQQQREIDRQRTKDVAASLQELHHKMSMLFFRTEMLTELLKDMGVTDEQIDAVEQKVVEQFSVTKVQVKQ